MLSTLLRSALLSIPLTLGCGDAYTTMRGDTSHPTSLNGGQGAIYAPVAAGAAAKEYAAQPDEELVFGWEIKVEAGTTRWRECTSATDCTDRAVSRPVDEVLGVTSIGRARRPGADTEVDVFRIRLARDKVLSRRP
jgi:hypothetical protein